ncbi:short-chain alcohol dehydrogenase [Bernardetia litoralis DSM 6794]|uniref:Short-chain alcohol dehydrogenase n=1 Tax=Bernardetia litoralis (strain ATCC 23117 / DSM 6794 / NBRC 15988 / NCIMB 1366 / Fx l1 / Sio-4) TaxID=880071 RepID=I4AMP8_BERLS|nr:SDR family NAD(P)-dependent oxidoreductase [Bernardetia litoralis]AFM05233.1 short-chain alcohol dehydrogenase [Bernardetia litoralis DSM 6794]
MLAFITGATSGIGLATARIFAENNIDLILCGRRKERLQELEKELSQKVKVTLLSFDVSNRDEVKKAVDSLSSDCQNIDVLINNAGNAHGHASIQDGNLDDWDAMINLNVKGLLYVTKAILPKLLNKTRSEINKGQIINIGSIAGIDSYPNGNIYCATKSAVAMLSETMRIDLFKENVKVSEVKPGLVETEFAKVRFKNDDKKAKEVYQNYTPLTPKDIAELIYFVISRPAHVNVADVLILPADQAKTTLVNKR